MRIKLTLFLCLSNIIVFYLIYFLDTNNHQDLSSNRLSLLSVETNDIERIEIKNRDSNLSRVLQKRDESWRIVSPISWPANHFAVQRLISQLQVLEPEVSFSIRELEESGQTLSDYGLESPQATIDIFTEEGKQSVLIGNSTNLGNRVYITVPKYKNDVLVVKKALLDVISMAIDELRSQDLFNVPYYELNNLSIQYAVPQNIKIRLTKKDDAWKFDAPIQAEANTNAVDDVIAALTSLEIDNFILNKTKEECGLATPELKLSISGNNHSQTLLVGKRDLNSPESNCYYAKLKDNPTIFTVRSDTFNELKNAQELLREKHFLTFDENDINDIQITQSNHSIDLQKLETGAWEIRRKDSNGGVAVTKADNKIVFEILAAFKTMEAQEFISDAPSALNLETYGFNDPQRTVTLGGKNLKTKILIGNLDETGTGLYAKLSNSPYIYKVDTSIIAFCPISELYYRDRTLHQLPKGTRIESVAIKNLQSGKIIFEQKLDESRDTLEATFNPNNNKQHKYVASILKNIREFRVGNYLSNKFDSNIAVESDLQLPWDVSIELVVIYPGNSTSQKESYKYFFTKRLSGGMQIGGSPQENVTFSLTQEMIDSLFPLVHESNLNGLQSNTSIALK